jgi:hypothetical protein
VIHDSNTFADTYKSTFASSQASASRYVPIRVSVGVLVHDMIDGSAASLLAPVRLEIDVYSLGRQADRQTGRQAGGRAGRQTGKWLDMYHLCVAPCNACLCGYEATLTSDPRDP